MTNRIIKISGCHECRKKRFNHDYLYWWCKKGGNCGSNLKQYIRNKILPEDCPLDKEVTLKDLAIEDAGKLAEHIRDCARQDAVKYIKIAQNLHKNKSMKCQSKTALICIAESLLYAIKQTIKQVDGKSNKIL